MAVGEGVGVNLAKEGLYPELPPGVGANPNAETLEGPEINDGRGNWGAG